MSCAKHDGDRLSCPDCEANDAMTPKTLEQMAEEYFYSPHQGDMKHSDIEKAYLAGAKAALSLAEVRAVRDAILRVRDVRRDMLDGVSEQGDLDNAVIDLVTKALAAFDRLLEGVEK